MSLIEQRKSRYERFQRNRSKDQPGSEYFSSVEEVSSTTNERKIDDLPNEILYLIFLFSGTTDIFQRLSLVNQKFYHISKHKSMYIELFLRSTTFGKTGKSQLLTKQDVQFSNQQGKCREFLQKVGGIRNLFIKIYKWRKVCHTDYRGAKPVPEREKRKIVDGEELSKAIYEYFSTDETPRFCFNMKDNRIGMMPRLKVTKKKTDVNTIELSLYEMEAISWGRYPYCMECRWFVYLEEVSETIYDLFMHRSWGGVCRHIVRFERRKSQGEDDVFVMTEIHSNPTQEDDLSVYTTEHSEMDQKMYALDFIFWYLLFRINIDYEFGKDDPRYPGSQYTIMRDEYH